MNKMHSSLADQCHEALRETVVTTHHSQDVCLEAGFLSLLEVIDKNEAKYLTGHINRLRVCERLTNTPIIGVCGMLNSGKSSLVAHLLSTDGRERVLIGDDREHGTHRFVFWAPDSWSENVGFKEFLNTAFDGEVEELSPDIQQAAEQYNARTSRVEKFGTPLLSFDSALANRDDIAILDCPDIQRSHNVTSTDETAWVREEALKKASRLCSAFFVVASVEQVEDSRFRNLFEILETANSDLPVYVFITKVHPDHDMDFKAELEQCGVLDKVRGIFVSLRLPQAPPHGYPEGLCYDHSSDDTKDLNHVISEFDASELQRLFVREKIEDVVRSFSQGKSRILEQYEKNRQTCRLAREFLLKFLDDVFITDNGTIRPIHFPVVNKALLDSLQRTAPRYIKIHFKAFEWYKKVVGGLSQGKDWLKDKLPNLGLRKMAEKLFRDKEQRKRKVTPERFAEQAEGRIWLPAETNRDTLVKLFVSSYNGIREAVDETMLRKDLDNKIREMWKELGKFQKTAAFLSLPVVLLAALATVLAAPIDLGGSTVIYLASLPELLAAGGLSLFANKVAVKNLEKHLEMTAARPQLSHLFALLQDGFGTPRATTEELKEMSDNDTLKLELPEEIPLGDTFIAILDEPVFELDSTRLESIEQKLNGLKSHD